MSNYGHYNHQYYGNRISFPDESFTIAGISHYTNICKDVTYDSIIRMQKEPENKYDPSAIAIYFNKNKIGYVPNNNEIKQICSKYIQGKLKIINICYSNNCYGIRVIPEVFYNQDESLEREIMFADEK